MRDISVGTTNLESEFIPQRHQLEQCIKPIHEAHGVPNEYYTRTECFNLEKEHLFNKGWYAVGFVKDLPQPGSAIPVNYFDNPMLLVRSKQDKKIRVFQNVCRHRGMILEIGRAHV